MHSIFERNGLKPLCDIIFILEKKICIQNYWRYSHQIRKHHDSMCFCIVSVFVCVSVLQVQTQPLTYVALVSWDWCIRCTLWWTQRLYRWLETSTNYHNTLHRYHQLIFTHANVCICFIQESDFTNPSENHLPLWGVLLCSWPWPLSSMQRKLKRKNVFPLRDQ